MASNFLLDTNVYALFLQHPPSPNLQNLRAKVESNGVAEFYIPEIVSMEIHSVLGKYFRSGGPQTQASCTKNIILQGVHSPCTHICINPAKQKMKPKVFRGLQKLIKDMESQSGVIKANIIQIGANEFLAAKYLLAKYSDQFSFGSHDALVAGTLMEARKAGNNLTLITSDKGLKAACVKEGLPIYDPNN